VTRWHLAFPWLLAVLTLLAYIDARREINRSIENLAASKQRLARVERRLDIVEAWASEHEDRGRALAKTHADKLAELRAELGHLNGFVDRLALKVELEGRR
jgi:hypothetical protein